MRHIPPITFSISLTCRRANEKCLWLSTRFLHWNVNHIPRWRAKKYWQKTHFKQMYHLDCVIATIKCINNVWCFQNYCAPHYLPRQKCWITTKRKKCQIDFTFLVIALCDAKVFEAGLISYINIYNVIALLAITWRNIVIQRLQPENIKYFLRENLQANI